MARLPRLRTILGGQGGEGSVAGLLFTSQVLVAASSLAVTALSARSLGTEGRGALALVLQLTYVFASLAVLGFDRGFLSCADRGSDLDITIRRVLGLMRWPLLAVAVAAVLLAWIFGVQGGTLAAPALVFAVLLSGQVVSRMVRTAAIVALDGRMVAFPTAIAQFVLVAAAMALAYTGGSVLEWALLFGLAGLCPWLVTVAWRVCRPGWWKRSTSSAGASSPALRDSRRAGLRILPATVGEMALTRADRLIIPIFCSLSDLGIYTVVGTLTELATWPVQQYSESSIPRWAEQFRTGAIRPFAIVWRLGVVGLTLAVAVAIASWVAIPVVFGPEFAPGRTLVPVLSLAAVLLGVLRVATALDISAGRMRAANAANLSGMMSGLVAYFVLIPQFGVEGAAWGSVLGYLAGCVVGVWSIGARGRSSRSGTVRSLPIGSDMRGA